MMLQALGKAVVNNSRFIANAAKEGGAIWTVNPGVRLTINSSSFLDNRASYLGAGGAIIMEDGYVTIDGSSFVNNRSDYIGGAIVTLKPGQMHVSNSSFIGNRSAKKAGAVYSGGAPLSLTHVTMAGNRSSDGQAIAVFEKYPSRLRLRNSIISGGGSIDDCFGQLAQNIGNLIEDGSCSPKLRGDPMLGPAAGSPAYRPLLADSPAIGAADPAYCLPTDQVGRARPPGAACDIGALAFTADIETSPACYVTAIDRLTLRDGPGGPRIGIVPAHTTLPASALTGLWFRVEHRGLAGWISADKVTTEGDCD